MCALGEDLGDRSTEGDDPVAEMLTGACGGVTGGGGAIGADGMGGREMLGAWPRGPEGIAGAMGALYPRGPVGMTPGGGSRSLRGPLGGRRFRNRFRSTGACGGGAAANRGSPGSGTSGFRSM